MSLLKRAPLILLLCSSLIVALALPAFAAPAVRTPLRAIEGYAPYQAQSICSPTAKPGTVALRTLVMRAYPGSGDYGIIRNCKIGGRSEHKEGRAWDWKVSAGNAAQVRQVNDMLRWMFATDRYGNRFAMARRLGVMYIIWNHRIWSASRQTWRAYTGADPHTSHVHFSLGWAGALKRTSYWSGKVSPVLTAAGARVPVPTPPRPPVVTPPKPPTPPTPPKPPVPPVIPPPDNPDSSDSPLLQKVTVQSNAAAGTTSAFLLEAGKRYLLISTGSYHYGSGTMVADAECSVRPADGSWSRRSQWEDNGSWQGPSGHLDLQVQGTSTRWSTRDGGSCDTATHTYYTVLQPSSSTKLTLKVIDDNYSDNAGVLAVTVRELAA